MSINNLNTYLNVRDAHLRVVSGNVYAQAMNIGGINVETAHGLQSVSNTGNATSLTLEFANVTTGFVTTANAQIGRDLVVTGNATVSKELTVTSNAIVSSNLNVSDDLVVTNNILASNNLTVTGNLNVTTIRSDSNVVAEYTGPHDRPLRKYPEVALTSSAINSDYKGYTIQRSSDYTVTYGTVEKLFNNADGSDVNSWVAGWNGTSGTYDAGTGEHSGTYHTPGSNNVEGTGAALFTGAPGGEWVSLQIPNGIKLDHVKIRARDHNDGVEQYPKDFEFWGSNNGTDWSLIKSFTNQSWPGQNNKGSYHVNSNISYNRIAMIITKIPINVQYGTHCVFGQLEYYGYEEGSGSLDTTLKTVYNVPATTGTQLEVYYDAKNYTSGTITDESPNTYVGTLNGNTQLETVDGIKAFTFDGNGDTITGTIPGISGEYVHSITFWIKFNDFSTANTGYTLFEMGARSQDDIIGLYAEPGKVNYYFYSNDNSYSLNGVSSGNLIHDQWYHFTATYSGGSDLSNRKLYINGNEIPRSTHGGASSGALTLANGNFSIGDIIGGTGLNDFAGSIANFRLYSKVLNADQVKELYDFQKDYFLGSKSQVTLYKGHLGVGVTEPSGQLELAGDERIQEYPPRAFETSAGSNGPDDLYIEGHGHFKAWSTSSYGPDYTAGGAFTKSNSHTYDSWISAAGDWELGTTSTGLPGANAPTFAGYKGGHLILELPYSILLKSFIVDERLNLARQLPSVFVIIASNDGINWDTIFNHTATAGIESDYAGNIFSVNATKTYSQYGFVALKNGNTNSNDHLAVGEWRLFGTPGPTTLDKGSLSLTRSLDVPRVSRYDVDTETPRPEKLVLDLDTTVNSLPTDISGRGNHGTFKGTAQYSAADRAFVFDGNSDYIQGTLNLNGSELDSSYTISLWVKSDSTANDNAVFMFIGSSGTGDSIGFRHHNNSSTGGTEYRIYHYGVKDTSATGQPSNLNQWRHLVAVYDGTNQNIYVDGVFAVKDAAGNLGLPNNPTYSIGYRWDGGTASEYFDGMISSPKVWSVALEPSEVRKLYNLGRTGRSMVISDTAVGIGKAPEAQLDVRGNLRVGGTIQVPLIISHRSITADTTVTSSNYIPFSGIIYENPSGLHNGNYFVCPIKGVYECVANILTDNNGSYSGNHTWLINGSETSPTSRGFAVDLAGNNHKQATSHFYFELNSGDAIGLGGVDTTTWYGNSSHRHSAMSIRLITPT